MIELLATIAIVAILAAFAIPSMLTMVRNDRMTSQANNLVFMLSYARSEGVKRDSVICLCPSTGGSSPSCASSWTSGFIVHVPASTADCTVPATTNPTLQASPALTSSVTLKALSGSTAITSIGFAGTGLDYVNNGQITSGSSVYFTLCDPRGAAYARDIEVTAVGRAEVSPTPGKTLAGASLTCP